MENIWHKKNTSEEKNIFPPKMASENALKHVEFTYKSQILKFMIQQKVFNKKSWGMIRLNLPNFLYINDNSLLGCLKCKKHAIFSTFPKNPIILGFWLFFHSKRFIRKYKENWEHLNVSFRIYFIKHFLLYLDL